MDTQFDKGLARRKRVMGEDFVAKAFAGVTDFTAPIQHCITRNARGDMWQRKGLDLKTRSRITVAMPTALAGENRRRCWVTSVWVPVASLSLWISWVARTRRSISRFVAIGAAKLDERRVAGILCE